MKNAYLGIDIGSISTKGVILDDNDVILASDYLWTEGDPMGAAKRLIVSLGEKLDRSRYQVVSGWHDRVCPAAGGGHGWGVCGEK